MAATVKLEKGILTETTLSLQEVKILSILSA